MTKKSKVIIRRCTDINLIRRLHRDTFPDTDFYGTIDAVWWVGYCDGIPACFAGVDPDYTIGEGFLCRAGVLERFRGQGLQKRMLKTREKYLVDNGIYRVWTYVHCHNVASINSLFKVGYKAYQPAYDEYLDFGYVNLFKKLPKR